MSQVCEWLNDDWCITNFYNIPNGVCFRYNKEFCIKQTAIDYVDSTTKKIRVKNTDFLVAADFKKLPSYKQAFLRK